MPPSAPVPLQCVVEDDLPPALLSSLVLLHMEIELSELSQLFELSALELSALGEEVGKTLWCIHFFTPALEGGSGETDYEEISKTLSQTYSQQSLPFYVKKVVSEAVKGLK